MFFIIALLTLGLLIYLLNQHKHSFWEQRGFVQMKPTFLIGNIGSILTSKASMGEFLENIYKKHKKIRAIGIYFTYQPSIVINDPMLVQNIMITDFTKFHDRPVPVDVDNDPLQAHLFHMAGQQWRDLRVKLSPVFTSGKLKGMFPMMRERGQVLEEFLVKNVKNGVDVFEFRDLMSRFNTSIISSVAFGIDNDCVNEPDHIFRKMGAKNFEPSWRTSLLPFLFFFVPKLVKFFKLQLTDPEVEKFIFMILKQTVEHREKNKIDRKDFIQMLIELKDKGFVSVDKDEKDEGVKKLSFNSMAAQVFVFFVAGSDTSSLTMSYCLYELAKNPKIQQKVHAEIDRVLEAAGPDGVVTYEMMNDLKYLECCIDESLRKYPIVPLLFRVCNEEYQIPETDLTIPKGVSVMIPVLGLQRDPDIYESPMEFRPERFSDSAHGGVGNGLFYLPFGQGPRHCIGMRNGKLTTKLGLFTVLSKFSIDFDDKSMADKELEFNPKQFVLTPSKDFNLKLTQR